MSSSFDQFDFVSDSRDGKNFDAIKNLENASARGSKLASEMLQRLQFLTMLDITVKVDRKNKARFKTKYSFLGLLVSIQKDQIGCIRSNWPSFSVENLEELTTARIKLGEFINHWWWARVFADDNLRAHYFALQDAFGLQSQVESYRTEINDLWNLSAALDSKKSYLNSSRLNTIVLVAAIIGVIPGWVSILFS
jgi:hypothetical protein